MGETLDVDEPPLSPVAGDGGVHLELDAVEVERIAIYECLDPVDALSTEEGTTHPPCTPVRPVHRLVGVEPRLRDVDVDDDVDGPQVPHSSVSSDFLANGSVPDSTIA